VKFSSVAFSAIAAFALTGSAQAATYLVDYQSNGAAPLTANLVVTTSDVLNGVGGYDVTGISGDVSGDVVTHLIGNPAQPSPSYSADGWFIYDNVYYPGAPTVSYWGLLFGSAGHEYNLFSDSPTQYELYQATAGYGFTQNSVGTLFSAPLHLEGPGGSAGVDGVPEPASWMTMVLGFGLLGGLVRSNRTAARQIA